MFDFVLLSSFEVLSIVVCNVREKSPRNRIQYQRKYVLINIIYLRKISKKNNVNIISVINIICMFKLNKFLSICHPKTEEL